MIRRRDGAEYSSASVARRSAAKFSDEWATPDSSALRHDWRRSYIGMLLSFVAALTCAAASIWSEKTPPDDAQHGAAAGTRPP
jgi:hypothetical protein